MSTADKAKTMTIVVIAPGGLRLCAEVRPEEAVHLFSCPWGSSPPEQYSAAIRHLQVVLCLLGYFGPGMSPLVAGDGLDGPRTREAFVRAGGNLEKWVTFAAREARP